MVMKIRYSLFFLIVLILGQKGLGQTTMATPTFEDGVYKISSLAELSWVTQHSSSWTSSFVLTRDIDAYTTNGWDWSDDNSDGDRFNDTNDGNTSLGGNEGWLPIGDSSNEFEGNFDGKNYEIDAIRISVSNSSYKKIGGLFGYVGDANIIIENINLNNVYVYNNYSDTNDNTGGFIGQVDGSNVIVRNIEIRNADITGIWDVGGVIGQVRNADKIINCFFQGKVTGKSKVGGVIGDVSVGSSVVSNTVAQSGTATVTGAGSGKFGGIVGEYSLSANKEFNGNLFYGVVDASGDNYIGGLIGYVSGNITSNEMKYNVINGTVTGKDYVGGIIGSAPDWDPDFNNIFYNNITAASVSGSTFMDAVIGQIDSGAYIVDDYYESTIYLNTNNDLHSVSSPAGFTASDFTTKSKYEGYSNWNSSLFEDQFIMDTKVNLAVPRSGTRFLQDLYVKAVRGISPDGSYKVGETIQINVIFNRQFTLDGGNSWSYNFFEC